MHWRLNRDRLIAILVLTPSVIASSCFYLWFHCLDGLGIHFELE